MDRMGGSIWQRSSQGMARLRGYGQVAVVVFFGLIGLFCVGVAAVAWHDNSQPVTWGRFTETSTVCDGWGRGRTCTISGDWISDDGSISRRSVQLNGDVEPGETVAAGYRASGLINDIDNNLVHSGRYIHSGPWISLLGGGFSFAAGAFYWRRYHRG